LPGTLSGVPADEVKYRADILGQVFKLLRLVVDDEVRTQPRNKVEVWMWGAALSIHRMRIKADAAREPSVAWFSLTAAVGRNNFQR
jgi:hypothetical protein